MMPNEFWEHNFSISDVARMLGTTRQNISQRVFRKSIPCNIEGSLKGIPEKWVLETIAMRERDKEKA
jgi:transcriptional regulator